MSPAKRALLFIVMVQCASPAVAVFGWGRGNDGAKKIKDLCAKSGWGIFGREVPTSPHQETPLRPFEMNYKVYGEEH